MHRSASARRPSQRRALYTIHIVFLAAIGFAFGLREVLGLPARAMVDPLCYGTLLMTIWLLWSTWRMRGTLLDLYGIVLMAALPFNAGQALLRAVGAIDPEDTKAVFYRFPDETIASTLLLALLYFWFIHHGAIFSSAAKPVPVNPQSAAAAQEPRHIRAMRIVGMVFLVIGGLATLSLAVGTIAVVLERGYFGLFESVTRRAGIVAVGEKLAGFALPGAFLFLASGTRSQFPRLIGAGTVIAYAGLQIAVGNRGDAIPALVGLAWLWGEVVRPLPKTVLIAGLIGIMITIPLVKRTRSLEGPERFTLEAAAREYGDITNPAVESVREMGSTMVVTAYTFELVPSQRPFDMGVGYLYALSTLFPNLFWEVHPAVARGLPAQWLIETVDPITAERGGGLGFSFIAEGYLNFGWWSVLLVGWPLGYLLRRFANWADESGDPARHAVTATWVAMALFFVRQDSTLLFRSFAWYAFVPYLMVALATGRLGGLHKGKRRYYRKRGAKALAEAEPTQGAEEDPQAETRMPPDPSAADKEPEH